MVVHHADRLHEGIDDRRTTEGEALGLEGLGDAARDIGLGLRVGPGPKPVLDWLAVDEVPQEPAKTLALLNREISAGARDRALDLGAVAYDPLVKHQCLDTGRREAGD